METQTTDRSQRMERKNWEDVELPVWDVRIRFAVVWRSNVLMGQA